MRHESLIEFTGLSLPPLQSVLAAAGFILFHACVHIGLARLEHPVDQTGAVVGHGRDGCGGAESCPEASIVGAQGAITVQQRLRSPAQGVGGAGAHGAGAALEPSPPLSRLSGTDRARRRALFVFPRRLSRPIAARRVGAVSTSMPSRRVTSTPCIRASGVGRSPRGSWRRAFWGRRWARARAGVDLDLAVNGWRWAAMRAAHAALCCL